MKNKVTILAHRGYWQNIQEKNTLLAIKRAFDFGFGIETDIRDIMGKLVISHDMPKGNEMGFGELFELLEGKNLTLALNIKADGLGKEIKNTLEKYHHTNYFTFDMSIPEMVVQNNLGLDFFTGYSDIIKNPIMLDNAKGIWLDSFYSDWFGESEIKKIINSGKKVCIVSPELHSRNHLDIWKKYKDINGIILCTDYPEEAEEYFNG